MKRVLFAIITLLSFTSCSYMQFVSYSSDNVTLKESGEYLYQDENIAIEYLLNGDDGVFYFAVTNISDNDIYIDLNKSVFVYNDQVFDYGGISITEIDVAKLTNKFTLIGRYSAYSAATSVINGTIQTQTTPDKVLIPSQCYRYFKGFKINNGEIKVDGLNRVPKSNDGEVATVTFDMQTSPIRFTNRLTLIINNVEQAIENTHYVHSIENVEINDRYINILNIGNNETITVYEYKSCDDYQDIIRNELYM